MNNIFEDAMAAFEFTDKIADFIAADWLAAGSDNSQNLYHWIQEGLADSLVKAVRKRVEC